MCNNNIHSNPFDKTRSKLQEYLETLQVCIRNRLLSDEEEHVLCEHVATLTNLKLYQPIATDFGAEAFCLRVFEIADLVSSCKYTTHMEVFDEVLK